MILHNRFATAMAQIYILCSTWHIILYYWHTILTQSTFGTLCYVSLNTWIPFTFWYFTNSREDLFSHDPSIETRTLVRRPWQAGFTNQYFLRFPALIASYSSQPGQANSSDQYCIHPKSRNISSFHIFAIEKETMHKSWRKML